MNIIEWKWLNRLFARRRVKGEVIKIIHQYGEDILNHPCYLQQSKFKQHGCISVVEHCYSVAYVSLCLALVLHLDVDFSSLVRGALLHDYFLYDWHCTKGRFHGFTHAQVALVNAKRDFVINEKECDIIKKHMFPLNIRPPKYKEAYLVCVADKISATYETLCCRKPLS